MLEPIRLKGSVLKCFSEIKSQDDTRFDISIGIQKRKNGKFSSLLLV
jgi:hypothetical protein